MKQMRVGTFSLGILLVIIGILILFGGIKGISGALLILKFWPIILISIGIEILYFVYRNKGEEVRLKYDVLAVFIFIILVLISSGVFVFNEFMDNEVSNVIMIDIKSKAYSDVLIKEYEYNKKDIDRVVIKNSGNITMNQSTDEKIRIKTSVVVKANNKDVANEYKEKIIDINEQNRTLIISDFNEESIIRLIEIGEIETKYEIFIPQDIDVDIDNNDGKINISGVKNKLDIYMRGSTLTGDNIEGDINIKEVYSRISLDNITGNVKLDTNGQNITLNNINGNLSGKVLSNSMNVDTLSGKCELSLKDCTLNLKYNDKIKENINIDGEDSSVKISIPKNQEGNFYLESRHRFELESKRVFKDDDIKVSQDNRVIDKKIGEGPEIKINANGGALIIK